MSNALFATDFHHGPIIEAKTDDDRSLYGNRAPELHRAFVRYANLNTRLILDGGDQSTYTSEKEKHLALAARARKFSMRFRGTYSRAIGNHDPFHQAIEYLFHPETYKVNQRSLRHTDVVVLQPEVSTTLQGRKNRYDYAYSADKLVALLEECKKPNLIIMSHWAFNRNLRGINFKTQGKPYEYLDHTGDINEILHVQVRDGKEVLTLHGHEHYFSYREDFAFRSLVMPSIVQSDIDFDHLPCGLFAQIRDKRRGGLSVEFKKIAVGEKRKRIKLPRFGIIDKVPENYMRRYMRPPSQMSASQQAHDDLQPSGHCKCGTPRPCP